MDNSMDNSKYIDNLMKKFAAAKQADGSTNITGFDNAQILPGDSRGAYMASPFGFPLIPYPRIGDYVNTFINGGPGSVDPNDPNQGVATVPGGPAGRNWINPLSNFVLGSGATAAATNFVPFATNYARNFRDLGSNGSFGDRLRQALDYTNAPVGTLPEAQLRSFYNSLGIGSGAQIIGEGLPVAPRFMDGTMPPPRQIVTPPANPVKIDATQAAFLHQLRTNNPNLRDVSLNDLAKLLTDTDVGRENIHRYVALKQQHPDMTVDQFKEHLKNTNTPFAATLDPNLKPPVAPVPPKPTQEIQEDPVTGAKTKVDVPPTLQQLAEYDASKKKYDADSITYNDTIAKMQRAEQAAIAQARTPRGNVQPGEAPVSRLFDANTSTANPRVAANQGWLGKTWDWLGNTFINKNIDSSRASWKQNRITPALIPALGALYAFGDLGSTRETVGVESVPGSGVTPLTPESVKAIQGLGGGAEGAPRVR